MAIVTAELRAVGGVPYRPNTAKVTFSFESLLSFLTAVRVTSHNSRSAGLDIVDEGVGGCHQISLFYTVQRGAGKVYLRLTDDPAKAALNPKAGLFRVSSFKRSSGSRILGHASYNASAPVSAAAINRVLHGLPVEASLSDHI